MFQIVTFTQFQAKKRVKSVEDGRNEPLFSTYFPFNGNLFGLGERLQYEESFFYTILFFIFSIIHHLTSKSTYSVSIWEFWGK